MGFKVVWARKWGCVLLKWQKWVSQAVSVASEKQGVGEFRDAGPWAQEALRHGGVNLMLRKVVWEKNK